LTNSTSEIVHVDGRKGEIARRKPNIERAGRELQWRPRVALADGLLTTIQWSRAELSLGVPA